nr:PREDICTED: kinetochore protein Spc25 [Anolis carolinensis]|eukprot:XP_003216094.2 PREDICTED: kinetochore protein Spc25 [Anolis carolinensis]
MAKAKEEDELTMLEKGIEELCTQIETTYCRQSLEKTSGPRNKCYKYITSLKDNWSKKLAEGDEIIRKVHQYTNECCQKNKLAEEKQQKLSEILAIIEDEKKQEKELKKNIQALKEELIRKNKISAENKATEEVTEKLRNAENLFKEGLGLEIRRTSENQLQFIFRCISRKDFDEPYTLTLSLNEEGTYEVISCFPPLDCIKELQAKVRETNNFSAFIANVRKAFVTLTYK